MGCGVRPRVGLGGLFLILVDDEFAFFIEDSGGDEDEEVAGAVDFGSAAEEGADDGDATEDGDGLDEGGLFPFEDAAHGYGFAGANHDAGGDFLRTGFGESDIEGAGDITVGVGIAEGGEGDELDVLADFGVEGEDDTFAVVTDTGEDVEFDAGLEFGGASCGDEGGGGVAFGEGSFDGIFLVVVLDFTVADSGGAVIEDGESGGAEGLAFAALFQGGESGAERGTAEDIGEGLLYAEAGSSDVIGGDEAGKVLGCSCDAELSSGFPDHAELHEGGLGDGDEAGFDEDLLDGAVEFLDEFFEDFELFAGGAGYDEVSFVVDVVFTGEEVGDGGFDGGDDGGFVIDEGIELHLLGDGGDRTGFGVELAGFREGFGSEHGWEEEAFSEAVEAGFLVEFGGVFGIDDPDEVIPDLELEVHITGDVIEEFAEADAVEVHAEGFFEGFEAFIGDEVDAVGLADVEDDGFEGGVIELDGDFLIEDLLHAALLGGEVEEGAFHVIGTAEGGWDVGGGLDLVEGVTDVFTWWEAAVFLFEEEFGDGGVEDGVTGVDFADSGFEVLGLAEFALFGDPATDAFDGFVAGVLFREGFDTGAGFLPFIFPCEVEYGLEFGVMFDAIEDTFLLGYGFGGGSGVG